MTNTEVNFREDPKLVKLIEFDNAADSRTSTIKEILNGLFNISVQRGLTDGECSLLLQLFLKGSLSVTDKLKLLQNLVPEEKIPEGVVRSFMVWFISDYRKCDNIGVAAFSRILQWIIGLLEHGLVDSAEIYNFYDELCVMLENPNLVPYVAKLLCKLTKPDDVTGQMVRTVFYNFGDPNNKYILAVLNVFKGYKPHLMLEEVKKVDIHKVLKSVPQKMDQVMRVRVICTRGTLQVTRGLGIHEVPTSNLSYFKEESNKISSLIPLPTYNFEGTEKLKACYPDSVEEAFRKFSRVPIPQNIMSLLHNDAGFFTITYQGIEEQMRFQNSLLQTLQNALIYKELKTSPEDVEFLLRRIYCLETFMQQGIPSVSVFLSGFLLDWDGLEHIDSILKLIEWGTFHSFRELACNILRPLHMQFVTKNISMKKKIIQSLKNLIRNMFADLSRVQQGIPFPFLKRGPKWTKEPFSMLDPLIAWTQNLIKLGLTIEHNSSFLIMESIQFYYMMNLIEAISNLQMFTVVPEALVLQSLLSQDPKLIHSICRLLLRYHREFYPQMRSEQPHFYEWCKDKIALTSNYAKKVIYFLQNAEVVVPRKENGTNIREVPNETLAGGRETFNPAWHLCFVSTFVSYKSSVEAAAVELRDLQEFIYFFSPSVENGAPW